MCVSAGEHGGGASAVPAKGDAASGPLRGSVHRGPERRRPVEERQLSDPAEEPTRPKPGTHTHTRTSAQQDCTIYRKVIAISTGAIDVS